MNKKITYTALGIAVIIISLSIFNIQKKNISCTSEKGNAMTYGQALEIAQTSTCRGLGDFTGKYSCNSNEGGLVNVHMKAPDHPTCGLVCYVSIDTGRAEEGWMCGGNISSY